ncbi:hypothetical protein Hanom_Chr10g00913801 [Helianthus anomalus]
MQRRETDTYRPSNEQTKTIGRFPACRNGEVAAIEPPSTTLSLIDAFSDCHGPRETTPQHTRHLRRADITTGGRVGMRFSPTSTCKSINRFENIAVKTSETHWLNSYGDGWWKRWPFGHLVGMPPSS